MSENIPYYLVTGWLLGIPEQPTDRLSLLIQCKAGEFAIDIDAEQAEEIAYALLAAVKPTSDKAS